MKTSTLEEVDSQKLIVDSSIQLAVTSGLGIGAKLRENRLFAVSATGLAIKGEVTQEQWAEMMRMVRWTRSAATLWLASGEAPEWIARQMGHTSTEMLFRVYSRYVPNLTRQDGSAMERLLASRVSLTNTLQDHRSAPTGTTLKPAATPAMPVPKLRGATARQVQDKERRKGDAPPAPRAKPPPAYAAYA